MQACRTGRLALCCPALTSLSLASSSISFLSPILLPALTSADLGHCSKISDLCLRSTLTSLHTLTALNLEYVSMLSDDSVREVGGLT